LFKWHDVSACGTQDLCAENIRQPDKMIATVNNRPHQLNSVLTSNHENKSDKVIKLHHLSRHVTHKCKTNTVAAFKLLLYSLKHKISDYLSK